MASPFTSGFRPGQPPLTLPQLTFVTDVTGTGSAAVSPSLFSGGLSLGSIFLAVAVFFLVRVFIRKK
jgi:hypothetical protein